MAYLFHFHPKWSDGVIFLTVLGDFFYDMRLRVLSEATCVFFLDIDTYNIKIFTKCQNNVEFGC